jgi:hypothetical protein
MHRGFMLGPLLALLCIGHAARAQYDDAAIVETTAPARLSPEGRPLGGLAASPLSYAVWHEEGGWRVRATAAAGGHTRFSGSINTPFGVSEVRAMSSALTLQSSATGISFDFLLTSGQSGFDFQTPPGSCLDFRMLIDGRDRPSRTAIGKEQAQPGPGGFDLCGPGKMEAQSIEGPQMDPQAFRAILEPVGGWVEVEGYGLVWQPSAQIVGSDFIPYADGKWVYTTAGWVFVSSYDWGWAPFHYGNWVSLDSGWYWVPGSRWGPAWVEWRYATGYIGWTPLPPIDAKVVATNPAPFTYAPVDRFTAPSLRPYVVAGERAETLTAQSSALVSAAVVEGQPVVPVNAGPPPQMVVVTGTPVTPVPVTTLVMVVPPPATVGVVVVAGPVFVVRPMPYYKPYPYPYYGRPPPYYGAPGYHPPYYGQPGRPVPVTPVAPPPGARPPPSGGRPPAAGGPAQPPRVTPVPPAAGSGGRVTPVPPSGGGGNRVTPSQPVSAGGSHGGPATRPSGASPSTRPSTTPSGNRTASGSRGSRGGGGRR